MNNIFTYLDQVAFESCYDKDFSALDFLILTEIAYLDFDGILSSSLDLAEAKRMDEAAQAMTEEFSIIQTKNRHKLLQEAAKTKRYKALKMLAYVHDFDQDVEKQFAALTYQTQMDTLVIAFRGTDDTIIGWKEDFHMTYMPEVPAQKTAVAYVKKVMAAHPKARFILTGHSKGGNLAAYAASHLSPDLQERISAIYSFDAPGLNQRVIESQGYQAISQKISRFIPQGSLVGMMLEVPEQAQIVKSRAIGGIAQHDTFSWQIEDGHFVLLDKLNPDSLQMDQTLKNWCQQVSDEELKDFFDVFFGLILDAEIESIDQLFQPDGLKKVNQVLENAKALNEEEKDMLHRLTQLLLAMRYEAWLDAQHLEGKKEDLLEFLGKWKFWEK